jgi:hypothetical protein
LFEAEYQKGCAAFFALNARGSAAHPRIAAQVLAAAVAGVVHEAARQGMLNSPVVREELIALVESRLSRRSAATRSA